MANIVNQYGQVKVGVRNSTPVFSSLLTSLYAAYNAESNANDSLNTYNGTAMGGLTYTTGKIGNAFNFNGTNSYVSLPNDCLNISQDFSFSAWYYSPSAIASDQGIIGNYNSNTRYGWGVAIYDNRLYGYVSIAGNNYSFSYTNASVIGAWNNVVFKFVNGTGYYLYLNATLVASFTTANNANAVYPPRYTTSLPCRIGLINYSGDWWYLKNGTKVDAVNVWTRELTQSEITELYNSGNGKQYPF